MRILALLVVISITLGLQAQDRSIEFRNLTFDEAIATSKAESKPIFVDCYTVWCGPCKWMSANIFTNNAVADYYNENFVCVKFDMEKGEGIEIAKEFNVRAFPTLIFVNGERELVMKTIGASQEIESYIKLGDNARSLEYNLVALAANVEANKSDAAYMSKYFTIMAGAQMANEDDVEEYLKTVPKEDWTSAANFNIISMVVEDMDGAVFKDVLERKEAYAVVNGAVVNQYITYVIQDALMSKLYSRATNAEELYEAKLAEVKGLDFEGKGEVVFMAESTRLSRKSLEEYMAFCVENVEEYLWDNPDQLNNVAWTFYENATDETYLAEAEKWAERAVSLLPQHHILDTYANLLYANKKYKKALEVENEAIKIAESQGADTTDYSEVVQKIEAALEKA